MIDETNFKNLLIADFYIRFRERINKKGFLDNFIKKPDAQQKLEKIATKVYDEVRKLDATQHIVNKEQTFEDIKKEFFNLFESQQDIKDSDFLERIDGTADGHEFCRQFAILVKKDGKISEWEKQAIYQLGEKFNISKKDIDKQFKSSKWMIIILVVVILLSVGIYFTMQNKDVQSTINGLMKSYQQSEEQATTETTTNNSETETTTETEDYKVKFSEYEIKKKLTNEFSFHIGGFQEKVDAEKEPDFFEDFKIGERQIILPVIANFKYIVYFDEIGEIVCDEEGVVRFTLPPIHLQEESCEIDWTHVIEKVSWTRKSFTPEEKNKMKNAAEKYLTDLASKNYNYRSKALQNAETKLTDFFESMGFKVIIYKSTNIIID
ncbi:MAG: DUF4230 domain-containing protein [Alphaproteobacteria bacterium]|nr:DUF4230 domain-containing protein [Alphaproteobacteria bacterium]